MDVMIINAENTSARVFSFRLRYAMIPKIEVMIRETSIGIASGSKLTFTSCSQGVLQSSSEYYTLFWNND